MKKNVNFGVRIAITPIVYADNNKPVLLAVDNFPGQNPAYKKPNGFRCNDISLLDRLSYRQDLDEDLAKIVAGRVKEISTIKDSSLTPEQMLRTLRPSWVQTAAEVRDWEEDVFEYMSTTNDVIPDDVQNVNQGVSSEVVEESKVN